ncbi:hypothetical protein WISP_126675 [Willisornis vidua]|uniref:Uncharacterized protein n=1 Tax=Willisornis vidua TaxID=1566151 RepID=A0ABQ9CQP0_9PASS|nr:hypothetical protein WISP_126675 [Willisornis vidua]
MSPHSQGLDMYTQAAGFLGCGLESGPVLEDFGVTSCEEGSSVGCASASLCLEGQISTGAPVMDLQVLFHIDMGSSGHHSVPSIDVYEIYFTPGIRGIPPHRPDTLCSSIM